MANIISKPAICLFIGMLLISSGAHAQDDFYEPDPYAKIRLGFTAPTGFYRQILIGFQGGLCTEGIDPGYDAVNTFDLPCDMYFYCNDTELFIQGVGAFSTMSSYPLGVKLNAGGEVSIALENVENLSSSQAIYIYDDHTGQYHNLKSGNFIADLDAGVYNSRFSLRFFEQTTLGTDPTSFEKCSISYISAYKVVYIQSATPRLSDTQILLYSITGQLIRKYDVTIPTQDGITIPVSDISPGIYVVQMNHKETSLTKKISIR